MKILNEAEQLKKRKDELFKLYEFTQSEINHYEELVRKKEDSWFSDKGKIRVWKYYIRQYQEVYTAISEYYSDVSKKLDEINSAPSPQK